MTHSADRAGAGRVSADISSGRLVFVSGLHRSGTTVLTDALGGHPAVSGLTGTGVVENEGQFLQDVYPLAQAFGGPGRFAWDERAHATERSPLATPENARRLLAAWSPYWDLDRTLLVEKSPPNLLKTRLLQALFPDAAHVVVLRHPVVVALATHKWARNVSLPKLVKHNLHAYRVFLADAPHLRRLHVLRYEELVAAPDRELAAIGRFLGLDSTVNAEVIRAGHDSGYVEAWAASTHGPGLRARALRRFRDQCREALNEFGYDVDDLKLLSPWAGRPGTTSARPD